MYIFMYVSLRKTASQLFGRFVSLSALNLSFAQSVSLLVGQLFSQSGGPSVSQSVCQSVGQYVTRSFVHSVSLGAGGNHHSTILKQYLHQNSFSLVY